jgi:hypothetical protein
MVFFHLLVHDRIESLLGAFSQTMHLFDKVFIGFSIRRNLLKARKTVGFTTMSLLLIKLQLFSTTLAS